MHGGGLIPNVSRRRPRYGGPAGDRTRFHRQGLDGAPRVHFVAMQCNGAVQKTRGRDRMRLLPLSVIAAFAISHTVNAAPSTTGFMVNPPGRVFIATWLTSARPP